MCHLTQSTCVDILLKAKFILHILKFVKISHLLADNNFTKKPKESKVRHDRKMLLYSYSPGGYNVLTTAELVNNGHNENVRIYAVACAERRAEMIYVRSAKSCGLYILGLLFSAYLRLESYELDMESLPLKY